MYLPVMNYKESKDEAVLVECTVVDHNGFLPAKILLADFGFTYATARQLCSYTDTEGKTHTLGTRSIQQYLKMIRSEPSHPGPTEQSKLSHQELVLVLTMFRFVLIKRHDEEYSKSSFLSCREPGENRMWLRQQLVAHDIHTWVMERTGILPEETRNYWEIIFP